MPVPQGTGTSGLVVTMAKMHRGKPQRDVQIPGGGMLLFDGVVQFKLKRSQTERFL
jgi:hypothetical protein